MHGISPKDSVNVRAGVGQGAFQPIFPSRVIPVASLLANRIQLP